MMVGLPGLLMAIWVRTLREPTRGISEGLVSEKHPAPFRVLRNELMAVVPPLNLLSLIHSRTSLRNNLTAALAFALIAWLLILATGSTAQWITTAFGVYVTFSWAQSLKTRDPATFSMLFRCKSFIYTMLAFPATAFVGYGAGFWIAPLLLRVHDVSVAEVGLYLGMGAAAGGFIGITLGGILADYLKQKFPSGRLVVGYISILGTIPMLLLLLYSDDLATAYWLNFGLTIMSACAGGVPPSTAADLVMPRMRAIAGAYYILVNTFIGLALGPYFMGLISDSFHSGGLNEAESLRNSITVCMLTLIPALVFMYLAQRHLPKDEASRLERAASLGEPVKVS